MPRTKSIQINVDQVDIDRGLPSSSLWCPIARAMRRTLGEHVYVMGNYAQPNGSTKRIKLPKEVTTFIHRFDNLGEVRPFKFEVMV